MKKFYKALKLTSLGLAISFVLQGQLTYANTENKKSESPNNGNNPSTTAPVTQGSGIATNPNEAINSVYRVWLTIPFSNTFVYELEQMGELSLGSQDQLDKQGYLRDRSNSGNDIILFKAHDKIHLVVAHGSGYAISNDGTLITNNHVVNMPVDELYTIKQQFEGLMQGDNLGVFIVTSIDPEFKVYRADVVDSKKDKDLAILKVQGLSTQALKFASIEHIQQTDDVTAIGFPATSDEFAKGLDDPKSYVRPATEKGSLKKQITIDDVNLWEHSVNITGGNSGGPLINQCAEVVATNVSGLQYGEVTLTAGAVSLTELLPLLKSNNIQFQQSNTKCNPNAVATTQTTTPATQTTTKPTSASETATSQNKPTILGMDSTIFWIILGGLILVLLVAIVLLAMRKKDVPAPPPSPATKPVVPPPPPVPPAPQPQFGGTHQSFGSAKTEHTSEKTIHLNGNYPITLRENTPFTVGRDPNSNLVISNNKVSSRHIQLIYKNNQVFVTDLQSTNGTFINGHRISGEVALQQGDTLSLTKENIVSWQYGQAISSPQRAIGELVPEGMSMSPITLHVGMRLTLGRNGNNDIVINSPTVSGNHCVITVDHGGNVEIVDNNSTNGTFIEQIGSRITRASLKSQQVLYIGSANTKFRFKKF